MKQKLALILISVDECFTEKGFSGGGHKVTKHLIMELINSEKFEIDIFCRSGKAWYNTVKGINSISVLGGTNFKQELQKRLSEKRYDYVLSSDILLPFANNLIHSNSSRYKSKNGKNRLMSLFSRIYNSARISEQEHNMSYKKAIFTVSEGLKQDYVTNFDLNPDKIFVCYPATDEPQSEGVFEKKDYLTIGSMVGGGLNKGGYLLLLAMSKLPKSSKIKAKFIYPKIQRAGFFMFLAKLLKVDDRIELVPRQADMNTYYNSIDCYVLPSLNEAFGLVVTESAANFKPSIVSSTTGVSELIQDGKNGFIFDREIIKIENLTNKLIEVEQLYEFEHDKFIKISKNAHRIVEKLSWKEFGETIINNMVAE